MDKLPSEPPPASADTAFALDVLKECHLCPRACGKNRFFEPRGWCRAGSSMNVASVCLHRGEEPVLSGKRGMCNIFFAHCNMQCCYCQNYQISSNETPPDRLYDGLAEITGQIVGMLQAGIERVGFVSPSHCLPQVWAIVTSLRAQGHHPIYVYNTNGYDRVETIRVLAADMAVFLPDMKYMDSRLAAEWSQTPDYPEVAGEALKAMYKLRGADVELDAEGLVVRGMIVRHLVLPGQVENSKAVLRFLADNLSPDVHLSLMAQYHPTPPVARHPLLGRRLLPEEYVAVLDEMNRLGFHRGWIQQLDSADDYLPDFDASHPFEH